MRSVKVEDSVAEKVKDLKKHIRAYNKLPVTEAQILSQAFEVASRHRGELLERLERVAKPERDEIFDFFLSKPATSRVPTDVAREHDEVVTK